MCTRPATDTPCRFDDDHVGACEPWPSWAEEIVRERDAWKLLASDLIIWAHVVWRASQ
jgi:hypothetical protein